MESLSTKVSRCFTCAFVKLGNSNEQDKQLALKIDAQSTVKG